MATLIVMPKLGNSVESCFLAAWKINEGDTIKKGDILCEVETDKAAQDVESDAGGVVLKLLVGEGVDVPVLSNIAVVGEAGEDFSDLLSGAAQAELSADKPEERGAVSHLLNERISQASAAASPAERPRGPGDFIDISPRARNLAEDHGLDISTISGSGPGGRIIERDISELIYGSPAISPAAREAGAKPGMSGSGIGGRVLLKDLNGQTTGEESGPLGGPRKIIAERTKFSLRESAQYTINASAKASALLRWRKLFKNAGPQKGLGDIGIGEMLMWAAARVLAGFPGVNAIFSEGVYRKFSEVHLGFAVDTPRGLMAPVIRNANNLSLQALTAESKRLAQKCKDGSISPDSLAGGTFTVSNLGPYGVESFTPVINMPQVAILGLCAISPKPVMEETGLSFLPHIGLSLTVDHQVLDGAPAAVFLKAFSDFVARFDPGIEV